jgi:hypothetical protein
MEVSVGARAKREEVLEQVQRQIQTVLAFKQA